MIGPILIDGAVVYRAGMSIDADGAPRAYALPESGLVGLDDIASAGEPGNWYGILTDGPNGTGKPLLQGPADPAPGYCISETKLRDPHKHHTDPCAYVDASAVPYISVARDLHKMHAIQPGDVAMVLCGDMGCAAVVADFGPAHKYGEGSIALAKALGIPSSPRTGGADFGVSYIIFPGSAAGWPRPLADIAQQVRALFTAWGGSDHLEQSLALV